MKRILKISALAFIIMLVSSSLNKTSAQPSGDDVSYQTFYDELSPYGRWVDYPGQGYVWVPDTDPDFRPYSTNGHWVWTEDYEWLWVSDYDWGWAPFHYGRWDNDPSYGWYWVPGYEWSPAWVAWRDGGDYYGWAPIRPGINISIGFNIGSYSPPYDFWSFAPRRYISSPRIYDYCVDRRQNVTIINYTTIINNNYSNSYGFRSGPRRIDVERYTGRINPVRFRNSNRPGRTEFRNNEISIYRPRIQHNDNNRFSPRQFERYNRQGNNNGNGIVRNGNGFGRNSNDVRRDNNINNRSNNLPRREEDNNSTFERRNENPVRQPQNNNGNNNPGDRRNMPGRNDNNTRQPNRNNERPVINPNQNNNNDNRRFEHRDNNNGNTNAPVRQQRPDMRNDNNRPQQQIERRPQQQQPLQQIERRPQQQQPSQQIERRPQQQQPRQIERQDNGNRQQNNNGNSSFRNSRKRD